ncbi:hypothetical protein [Bradyrhizobium pachyrhizi]|uniref:hypothetical protein n=1 Tax=Bradyrhizobium pachyrhizi TaxID=280333 RepID=UPI0012E3C7E9|nr:hypothetical protein [Bradyrhizobium pachyrhizi]
MGFIVTERLEHGVFGDPPCIVYHIDRIGPPAMMHAWTPSPFNDRLVAGPAPALVDWAWRLLLHVNSHQATRV